MVNARVRAVSRSVKLSRRMSARPCSQSAVTAAAEMSALASSSRSMIVESVGCSAGWRGDDEPACAQPLVLVSPSSVTTSHARNAPVIAGESTQER